jgi:hypothetical protein
VRSPTIHETILEYGCTGRFKWKRGRKYQPGIPDGNITSDRQAGFHVLGRSSGRPMSSNRILQHLAPWILHQQVSCRGCVSFGCASFASYSGDLVPGPGGWSKSSWIIRRKDNHEQLPRLNHNSGVLYRCSRLCSLIINRIHAWRFISRCLKLCSKQMEKSSFPEYI